MPATPHLALPYPAATAPANVPADMQALALALDKATLSDAGALGSRPAAGTLGRLYYDTAAGLLYFDTGSTWVALNAATPAIAGTLMVYAGASIPTGWLACDGSAVSRATYAALFAAIGTAHGAGDGSTTFNVPDCRDRVLYGSGGSFAGPVGSKVGASQATVTVPAHTHSVPDHAHGMPDHSHIVNGHHHNFNVASGVPDSASANFASGSAGNAAARNSHVPVQGSTDDQTPGTTGVFGGPPNTYGYGGATTGASGALTTSAADVRQPGVSVNMLIKT